MAPERDSALSSAEPSSDSYERRKYEDHLRFYSHANPDIPESFADLLEKSSGIPKGPAQVSHVRAVRDEAFKAHHYPCLGLYRFSKLFLSRHPLYKTHVLPLLTTLNTSEPEPILLDIGTCLGQDLRKLLLDGVPHTRLYGTDILPAFIDIGYTLFRDTSTFPPSQFLTPVDLFDPLPLSSPTNPLHPLAGRCSILHANAVFHLFNYADQLALAKRITALLIPRAGSLILGGQNSNVNPKEYPSRSTHRSKTLFRHDDVTWAALWERVGAEMDPPVRFRVKSKMVPHSGAAKGEKEPDGGQWGDEGLRWMIFEVWWE